MFGDEQSRTERGKGGKISISRKEGCQRSLNNISSSLVREKSEQKAKEREDRFGRNHPRISELFNLGMTSRINAIPYEPNKFENPQEQEAYKEGFYVNGNRKILGNLEMLTADDLSRIGANDYISNVDLNTLSKEIKSNTAYIEGYMMAMTFGVSNEQGSKKHR